MTNDLSPQLGGQSDVTGREPLTRDGVIHYWVMRLLTMAEEAYKGAVNSPLRRVGVTFSDDRQAAIRDMVEAGDVVGAQRAILDGLQEEEGE